MDSAKLNDWLQVIGIFALVASLIFVGIEMRQTHEISMSQTYQSRTAATVEFNSAFAANPAALSAYRKAREGIADEITTQEYDALGRTMAAMYFLYDNAHYQYQAGFVSDEFWEMTHEGLRRNLEIPVVGEMFIEFSDGRGRPEFRSLVKELGE